MTPYADGIFGRIFMTNLKGLPMTQLPWKTLYRALFPHKKNILSLGGRYAFPGTPGGN
jgi:hypothetical protein